jgi:hypothetical protein
MFAGMGAFDSHGRGLNAIFEKRPPWPIHLVSGGIYNVLPRPQKVTALALGLHEVIGFDVWIK